MKKSTIILTLLFPTILLAGCGNSSRPTDVTTESTYSEEATTSSEAETTSEITETEEIVREEFEVYINVEAQSVGNLTKFYIDTNLPDETVLMVSLRRGDYNTDDNFTAQDKTTVSNGKAESNAFSNKGEALEGNYDLSISMSIPSTQSDAVREVIGQSGEYMTGPIVEDSGIGSSKVVSALYTFSADDCSITYTDEYNNTVFRDE